jgi:methionine-rich copper-binding protein CopC
VRIGRAAGALFIGVLIGGAVPAAGHSLLVESIPAANAVLATPPRHLVLRFNNRIEKKLSRVRVVGRDGARRDVAVAVTGRADTLTGALPALEPGPWRLEWQVLSTDGHVVSGAFSFQLEP